MPILGQFSRASEKEEVRVAVPTTDSTIFFGPRNQPHPRNGLFLARTLLAFLCCPPAGKLARTPSAHHAFLNPPDNTGTRVPSSSNSVHRTRLNAVAASATPGLRMPPQSGDRRMKYMQKAG